MKQDTNNINSDLIMMTFISRIMIFLLALSCFFFQPAFASDRQSLGQARQEWEASEGDLLNVKTQYQVQSVEYRSAKHTLGQLQDDKNQAKKELEKIRKYEEDSPNIDFSTQIGQSRKKWINANRMFIAKQEYFRSLSDKITTLKNSYDVAKLRAQSAKNTYEQLMGQFTDTEISSQISSLRTTKQVKISVIERCSVENFLPKDCREKAKIKAERKAVEKGAIVAINSVTSMKNFKLTRDQVYSEVSANIISRKILKDDSKISTDNRMWITQYEMVATIVPFISKSMIDQIRQGIIAGLSYATVVNQDKTSSNNEIVSRREEVQSELDSSRSIVAPVSTGISESQRQVRIKQAEKQAETELFRMKQLAQQRAEKETTKQAKQEAKAHKKRFTGAGFY